MIAIVMRCLPASIALASLALLRISNPPHTNIKKSASPASGQRKAKVRVIIPPGELKERSMSAPTFRRRKGLSCLKFSALGPLKMSIPPPVLPESSNGGGVGVGGNVGSRSGSPGSTGGLAPQVDGALIQLLLKGSQYEPIEHPPAIPHLYALPEPPSQTPGITAGQSVLPTHFGPQNASSPFEHRIASEAEGSRQTSPSRHPFS